MIRSSICSPAKSSVLAVLLMAASLVGCGEKGPELNPVTGVVTLDGQPLPKALVTFTPTKGPNAAALTDASGKYELRYKNGDIGGAVGKYTVTFTTNTELPQNPKNEKIPLKYAAGEPAEIKPGPNTIDISN